MILVSKANIFYTESLRILADRLSQSETHLPLRHICYYSLPKKVGIFSTDIKWFPKILFAGEFVHPFPLACKSFISYIFTNLEVSSVTPVIFTRSASTWQL